MKKIRMKKWSGSTLTQTAIEQFSTHMTKGSQHLQQACTIYADAVAHDHTAAFEFEEAFPYITKTTWDKMRLVGAGALNSKILLITDRLGSKIMQLSKAEQDEIFKNKVEIVKNDLVIKKCITKMTKNEQAELFGVNGKPLTVEEQMAKAKSDSSKKSKIVPYEVVGHMLNCKRKCSISKKELIMILAKMA